MTDSFGHSKLFVCVCHVKTNNDWPPTQQMATADGHNEAKGFFYKNRTNKETAKTTARKFLMWPFVKCTVHISLA